MTASTLTPGHRAEKTPSHAATGAAPLTIRRSRALAKALAWLTVTVISVAVLAFAFQGTHSSGSSRKFALAVFTLGAGGFAALTAHLSMTWFLIWCAVAAPQRSSRRAFALKALRLWSPRAARCAVVALGVSATALSLSHPSRAFAEVAPEPPAISESASPSDSGGLDNRADSATSIESGDLSRVTTLGWAPTATVASASTIPSLSATPEPAASSAIAFSGSAQALPAPTVHRSETSAQTTPAAKPVSNTSEHPDSPTNDTYTVKEGDSLWSIAKRHLTHVNGERPTNGAIVREIDRIASLNREINDVDLIFPGQTVRL